MSQKTRLPKSNEGIRQMLMAFDTHINARDGALAGKYQVNQAERLRIRRALLAWQWVGAALSAMRDTVQSLASTRDSMLTGAPGIQMPLPAHPGLPAVPVLQTTGGSQPVTLESGFFAFFASLVERIQNHCDYDPTDGQLLGIEGAAPGEPDPGILPKLYVDSYEDRRPVLTCKKGDFQGYDIWLTRPGRPTRLIAFSQSRLFAVEEALPPAGVAETWIFEVQYRYQNAPFGQKSPPVSLTVQG